MKKKFSKILGVAITLALLLSMALVAAPVSALTQPDVSLDIDVISEINVTYTIMFTILEQLDQDEDIIVDFGAGTDLSAVGTADITIAATSGIGSDAFIGAIPFAVSDVDEELTITLDTPVDAGVTFIGAGALVQLIIFDVTNPDAPGDYTLDVSTTSETTPVTSVTYTIGVPTISPLPGIVSVYNAAGILMDMVTGYEAITIAIAAAGEDYTIAIGPGTYSEDTIPLYEDFYTSADGVTFESTGATAETILIGSWDIYNADITIDGLTIQGEMYIYSGGDDVLLTNNAFEKASSTTDEQLVGFSSGSSGEVVDNSFDTTGGATVWPADVAIANDSDGLVVTGNEFTVDDEDVAVGTSADAEITDNTFTGSSGVGVGVGGDDSDGVTISGNTFDGLENAILINDYSNDPNVIIDGNTIRNSTGDAIVIDDVYQWVIITNNSITGTDEDSFALAVSNDGHEVWMLYNNITGNAGNVYNDSGDDLDATHNWWGDAAGPASGSIEEDSGDILTWGWLGGPVELGTAVVAVDWPSPYGVDARTETGVTVSADDEAEVFGAAVYDGNPFTATPYPALGDIVDVYVSEDNDISGSEEVTIKLYADVNDRTEVMAWSDIAGAWIAPDNQGVSVFGGYVWMIVSETTVPSVADLAGIPLVLVTGPEPPPPVITLTAPNPQATDTVVANVAFTWNSVTGADSYELRLSGNAGLSSPIVLETLPGTAYTYTGTLDFETPYYWQVKAFDGATEIAVSEIWTFTTKAAPVPVVTVPPQPTPTLTVDIPDITVESPDVIVNLPAATITQVTTTIAQPDTPAYVWAIVAIGAVLSIAVIVLIVRTRRIV